MNGAPIWEKAVPGPSAPRRKGRSSRTPTVTRRARGSKQETAEVDGRVMSGKDRPLAVLGHLKMTPTGQGRHLREHACACRSPVMRAGFVSTGTFTDEDTFMAGTGC